MLQILVAVPQDASLCVARGHVPAMSQELRLPRECDFLQHDPQIHNLRSYISPLERPALHCFPSIRTFAVQSFAMRIPAEDNVPSRFELFLLGDGERKVTEAADTRMQLGS